LLIGIAAVVVLQLLFTYALPFQDLFETEAIPLWIWPRLFLGGLIFFLVVEGEKLVIRKAGLARAAPALTEQAA
jgi:cation transport ATPase-like protein